MVKKARLFEPVCTRAYYENSSTADVKSFLTFSQGLVRDGDADDDTAVMKIPGLKQLAGTALINSPLAPQPVKAYAKNLVEGLILDTITKQV